MKVVNVHEAKTTLSALLAEVEAGEDVVIARSGRPVARLVRVEQTPRRVRGSWRSLPGWTTFKYDASTFAPMAEEALKEEGWM